MSKPKTLIELCQICKNFECRCRDCMGLDNLCGMQKECVYNANGDPECVGYQDNEA